MGKGSEDRERRQGSRGESGSLRRRGVSDDRMGHQCSKAVMSAFRCIRGFISTAMAVKTLESAMVERVAALLGDLGRCMGIGETARHSSIWQSLLNAVVPGQVL
ncbi:unnamed protein product [Discosporangium mesarthrocarpum]